MQFLQQLLLEKDLTHKGAFGLLSCFTGLKSTK